MKALRLHRANQAIVDEIDEPTVRPGTVKVKIAAAGICGTDLFLYEHAPILSDSVHPLLGDRGPHTMGHEMAGHVVEVAPDVENVEVGDLVAVFPMVVDGTCTACRRGEENLCEKRGFLGIDGGGGGFSEYVVVAASQAYAVKAPFTAEIAALVEPLSTCWHAVRTSSPKENDVALIIGAGPIGLGLLLCLRAIGVQTVLVSEPSASRRTLARQLGAETVDPTTESLATAVAHHSDRRGAGVTFETSGRGSLIVQDAISGLRPGGTLVVIAEFAEPVEIDLQDMVLSGKRIECISAYTREDFAGVISAIQDGRLDASSLITSRIGLDDALRQGIEKLLRDGRNEEVKILVTP